MLKTFTWSCWRMEEMKLSQISPHGNDLFWNILYNLQYSSREILAPADVSRSSSYSVFLIFLQYRFLVYRLKGLWLYPVSSAAPFHYNYIGIIESIASKRFICIVTLLRYRLALSPVQ